MQLADYFEKSRGAQADLARALGVPQSLPSSWAAADEEKRRPVPVQHCLAIERVTQGEVTRRDLRPDDWHLIWPDLVVQSCEEAAPALPNAPVRPQQRVAVAASTAGLVDDTVARLAVLLRNLDDSKRGEAEKLLTTLVIAPDSSKVVHALVRLLKATDGP